MQPISSLALAFLLPTVGLAQQLEPEAAWRGFVATNAGEWHAEWNPATGTPHAIWGPGLQLGGAVTTMDAARGHAAAILNRFADVLGRGDSEFVEILGEKANRVYIFVYDQKYKGLSVISGRADVRVHDIGAVSMFGSSAVRIPNGFNITPAISAKAARGIAEERILGRASDKKVRAPRLVIWADTESKARTTATLAWEVQIDERPASVQVGKAYIDAGKGSLLEFKNEVLAAEGGGSHVFTSSPGDDAANRAPVEEVVEEAVDANPDMPRTIYRGRVIGYTNLGHNPLDPLTAVGLKNVRVTSPGVPTVYTNSSGFFSVSTSLTGNRVFTATLQGRYSRRVRVAAGSQLISTRLLAPNVSQNFQFNSPSSSQLNRSQTTTYWFTDDCHNWFRSLLPSSTALNNLATMNPRVNIASSCNAYYTSYTINFYQESSTCNMTAYETVIQHEWGHGADHAYGGISQTDGLSEGWGDILCTFRSRQPIVGPNFRKSGTVRYIRTALNTRKYPQSGGVHTKGQTWMGFAWDVRTNLIAKLGAAAGEARAISIIVKSIAADATNQPNAVREVFILDDDDGNLNNGTPNYCELRAAALKRTLPYPVASGVGCGVGPGKRVYVPDSNATAGGCNVIPFGTNAPSTTWANQRYQTMVTANDLGNPSKSFTICGLAFAPCGTGVRKFKTLQIIFGQTNATSLGTNFAANRPANARTVFYQQNYEWIHTANTWDPVGLETTYTFNPALGRNLVVEVIARGNEGTGTSQGFRTGSRQRLYNFGWTSTPATGSLGSTAALKMKLFVTEAELSTYGSSCKGSNGKLPSLLMAGSGAVGTNYGVYLRDALPNARYFLSIGFTLFTAPIDLGIIQAPGCRMYFKDLFVLGGVADAAGNRNFVLPIPRNTKLCERVYFQYFPLDARANRLGLTTTNYGRLLTGN